MPPRRTPPPFTDKQLAALETGRLSDLDRRLVATARQANLERDALADDLRRIREEVHTFTELRPEHERCLIVAHPGESIEVYADPRVKVEVCCVPETNRREEEEAIEWALDQVSKPMRQIVDDVNVKPHTYSVHCLSRSGWQLYFLRLAWQQWLNEINETRSAKDSDREPG